jgi:hypothetical protein
MRDQDRKNLAVHGFLLAITLSVTCTVAFLVIPADSRTGRFYASLFAILLLQLIGFLFPVFLALKDRRRTGAFRINLGTTIFLSVYSVGVMILVLLAFGPVSFSTVVALQLMWLLFFIFALGANAMGFLGTLAKRRRAPLATIESRFGALCDRLTVVEAVEALPLKEAFAAARDDLQYAIADSLLESKMAYAELNTCLERMERELGALEATTNPRSVVAGLMPVAEAVSTLDWELKRMRQALRRREALVG